MFSVSSHLCTYLFSLPCPCVYYKNDYYRWRSHCSSRASVCACTRIPPPPAGNDVKQIGAGRWLEDGGSDGDGSCGARVYPPFLCTQQPSVAVFMFTSTCVIIFRYGPVMRSYIYVLYSGYTYAYIIYFT